MGILKHLLFWPVTGPIYLAEFSMEKVQGVVRQELTDDHRIKEGLMDLQLRLEMGEIDDEESLREEAKFMAQLREVRHWQEQFGMGVRGGVVRVAQDASAEAEPDAEEEGEEDEGPKIASAEGAEIDLSFGLDDDEDGWSSGSSGGSDPDSSSS